MITNALLAVIAGSTIAIACMTVLIAADVLKIRNYIENTSWQIRVE